MSSVSEVAVAVLVLDAGVGKLDVAVVVRELVLDGPTMDLFRCSIGPSVALGLATIALLQESLILALQLVVEHDAADEGAVFAQPISATSGCAGTVLPTPAQAALAVELRSPRRLLLVRSRRRAVRHLGLPAQPAVVPAAVGDRPPG